MSKERELLEKILNAGWLNHELSCEVEAILAQPEQENLTPRQGLEEYKKGYAKAELDSKREPLNAATINYYLERLGSDLKWDAGFEAGVKWTEKCHGIGVKNE